MEGSEIWISFRRVWISFRKTLILFRLALISFRRILNSLHASWRLEGAGRDPLRRCGVAENVSQPVEMSRPALDMSISRASFWNARARCDKAGEPSAGRAFFSAAIISPNVRVWPSGRNMGS